jgi:hypothetical protein
MGRRQCELEGCFKGIQAGGTPHCRAHGGGKRCQEELLQGGCFRRHGPLRGALRGQAVPRGGLLQGSCYRRHTLQDAWRGQTVPAQGLPQVSFYLYRHGPLHRARRRQALPARGLPQGSSNRRHAALPGAWRRQALSKRGLLQVSRKSSWQRVLQAMSTARAARR